MHKKTSLFHPNSIVFHLMISFLCMLLIIETAGFLLLNWAKGRLVDKTKNLAEASVHSVVQNLESQVMNLSIGISRVANRNVFTSFYYNNIETRNSAYYDRLIEQRQELTSYIFSNSMIRDATVYYPSYGYSFSPKAGLISDDHSISQRLHEIYANDSVIKGSGENLFLSYMYPAKSQYVEQDMIYFITFDLDYSALLQYLSSFGGSYVTVLYHPSNNTRIYSEAAGEPQFEQFFQQIRKFFEQNQDLTVTSVMDSDYYVFAEKSSYLSYIVLQFIPINDYFQIAEKMNFFLLVYLLMAIPVMLLFGWLINREIIRPVNGLVNGYKQIEQEKYTVSIPEKASSTEILTLIHGFNTMAAHLNENINYLYANKLYTQKIELKQLQLQMNPHFLYNTYFILNHLIKFGQEEQAEMLSGYLGSYFQYITRNASDMIAMELEWEHAVNYLKIQEFRYTGRVNIEYAPLPEEVKKISVPRLIIQPLLENALEHGMKNIPEHGEVSLEIHVRNDKIHILVKDNGNSLSQEEAEFLEEDIHKERSIQKEITALYNISKRLHLSYPNGGDMHICRNNPQGMQVELILPVMEQTKKNVEEKKANDESEVRVDC